MLKERITSRNRENNFARFFLHISHTELKGCVFFIFSHVLKKARLVRFVRTMDKINMIQAAIWWFDVDLKGWTHWEYRQTPGTALFIMYSTGFRPFR